MSQKKTINRLNQNENINKENKGIIEEYIKILIDEKIKKRLLYIPNIIHDSVPLGKSEEDNVQVRVFGEKPSFDFEIKLIF